MPRVIIPSPLRKHANNQREVVIDGESLKETIEHLLQKYPGFKVINHDFALLCVFINSKLIRSGVDKWDRLSLNNDDEITLILPIAGG